MSDLADNPPRVTWLRTEDVIQDYRFNPEPFITSADNDLGLKIDSKLFPTACSLGTCLVRLWAQDSVERVAKRVHKPASEKPLNVLPYLVGLKGVRTK